jgi:hypothetical protein
MSWSATMKIRHAARTAAIRPKSQIRKMLCAVAYRIAKTNVVISMVYRRCLQDIVASLLHGAVLFRASYDEVRTRLLRLFVSPSLWLLSDVVLPSFRAQWCTRFVGVVLSIPAVETKSGAMLGRANELISAAISAAFAATIYNNHGYRPGGASIIIHAASVSGAM